MLPQPFISKCIITTSWKEGCCPLDEKNLKKKATQKILQRLPLTCTLKGFFLRFKPAVWWMSINCYHGFHMLAKRRFFPPFSSTQRNMLAFKLFLQYFSTRSDTPSCQDYKEYAFVECLLEETQIIDLLALRKSQPHKPSQYMLTTRLSSWYCRYFWILFYNMKNDK